MANSAQRGAAQHIIDACTDSGHRARHTACVNCIADGLAAGIEAATPQAAPKDPVVDQLRTALLACVNHGLSATPETMALVQAAIDASAPPPSPPPPSTS
jgi:hypothetical protein